MKNTIKFFVALTLMVIVGGGNVWAADSFFSNHYITVKKIGSGIVYIKSDDANATEVSSDDNYSYKATLHTNGDNTYVYLNAKPADGWHLKGFVTKSEYDRVASEGGDYTFEENLQKEGDFCGGYQVNLTKSEYGKVDGNSDDVGKYNDAKNGEWPESPTDEYYAIFSNESEPLTVFYYGQYQENNGDGKMGSVTSNLEKVYYGNDVTLTATAEEGCSFVKWTNIYGEEYSTDASISFRVTGSTCYIANFKVNDVTLGDDGVASFSTPKAVYAKDAGLKFYPATLVDGKVKLTLESEKTGELPSNTGAILVGNPNTTYSFSPGSGAINYTKNTDGNSPYKDEVNVLKSTAEGPVTADGNQYALGKRNDVVGFYKVKSGATIPQGKAYIVVTGSAKDFIGFADDDVTNSIAAKIAERMSDDVVYNLQGQRVADDYRGLVIKNGKKFINQ